MNCSPAISSLRGTISTARTFGTMVRPTISMRSLCMLMLMTQPGSLNRLLIYNNTLAPTRNTHDFGHLSELPDPESQLLNAFIFNNVFYMGVSNSWANGIGGVGSNCWVFNNTLVGATANGVDWGTSLGIGGTNVYLYTTSHGIQRIQHGDVDHRDQYKQCNGSTTTGYSNDCSFSRPILTGAGPTITSSLELTGFPVCPAKDEHRSALAVGGVW